MGRRKGGGEPGGGGGGGGGGRGAGFGQINSALLRGQHLIGRKW